CLLRSQPLPLRAASCSHDHLFQPWMPREQGGRQARRRSFVDNRQKGTILCCRSSTGEFMASKSDLLQGTLDLLILKTLASGPMHGWGVAQKIHVLSNDILQVNQGSLYPALHRLEQQGLISAEWGASDSNRQAKF